MKKIIKDIEGIVYRIDNYKENDLIVHVFTSKYNHLDLFVKGGQKTSNKSFYIFKMFNIICFDVFEIEKAKIIRYKSGYIVKNFDFTRLNFLQINAVSLISELLYKIEDSKDFDYVSYYKIIINLLGKIVVDKNNTMFYLNYLVFISLDYLGTGLQLDNCVSCNSKYNIIAYDVNEHGYICNKCYNNTTKVIKDRVFLNYLYCLNKKIVVKNSVKHVEKKVFLTLNDILRENAGIYLVSAKYL